MWLARKPVVKDALAEWLRRRPAKPLGFARTGSNPVGVVVLLSQTVLTFRLYHDFTTILVSILGLVGYDARLTRERSRVQSSEDVLFEIDL